MSEHCRAREMNARKRATSLGLVLGVSIAIVAFVLLGTASAEPAAKGPARNSQGWQTVYSETFDSGIRPGWMATDTSRLDGGEYTWGAHTFTPTSPITAAWCVGGGADGFTLTAGVDDYPDRVDAWLRSGPLELGDAWDADVRFRWWLDTAPSAQDQSPSVGLQTVKHISSPPEGGDWLGWCILTDPTDLERGSCTYVSGDTGGWMRGTI
ncbi:MAG: hypothetical protein PVH41_14885, partial [Anaerolineae bacterium]